MVGCGVWLCPPRPAATGGAAAGLPDLSGVSVGPGPGPELGPYSTAEGDPGRQGGDNHHPRQRLRVLPHPAQGPALHHPPANQGPAATAAVVLTQLCFAPCRPASWE